MISGAFDPDSNKYTRRHNKVHPDNFNKDNTSRLVYGTANGVSDSLEDFRQYNCLKHAILSGINQIDTGLTYRRYRSEHVVGQVLRTLTHKYGLGREEVEIISKQGWVGRDNFNEVDTKLLLREIMSETGLT